MTDALHAAIAEQAYYLWLEDGMEHGRSHDHWIHAEKLVLASAPKPVLRKASKAKASAKSSVKPLAKSATRAARIRFSETVLHA